MTICTGPYVESGRFDAVHLAPLGRKGLLVWLVMAAKSPLASHASTPAAFAFFRLLLFQCECGVNQGFLIATEPSIPAAILRINASANYFACGLAKVSRVA